MRKTLSILSLGLGLAGALAAGSGHKSASPGVLPDEAWRMLTQGNERFSRNMALHPHQDPERKRDLMMTQAPWAVVVGCSDSRLAPELIFDQGLGDLFTVRVAGNAVKGEFSTGSIEYAVGHLGSRLIVVLGHSSCGAVKAAVGGVKKDDESSIDELAAALKSPVDEARDKVGSLTGDALVAEAVERNVLYQMKELLKGSPAIAALVAKGDVKLVGGIYHLDNNRVTWLGQHPSEKKVIEGKKP